MRLKQHIGKVISWRLGHILILILIAIAAYDPRLATYRAGRRRNIVSFGVRYSLDAWLPPGLPFLTFFPAIILTTFLAGVWPGVFVAALSVLTAWYFFRRLTT
jgi:hypothetical protein